MELWIRSQDKLKMLKVDYLEYDFTKIKDVSGVITEYHKIIASYNNDWFSIGDYTTKERALEVLDEIHKCIVDKEVLDGNNNILTLANKNSLNEVKQILDRSEKIAVYEMPKE